MNSNKCPYLKKECEELYNPNKCLTNYEKCWEYGRLEFIRTQVEPFGETEIYGSLEKKTNGDRESSNNLDMD